MSSNPPQYPAGAGPYQPPGQYTDPGAQTFPQLQQTFQEMVVSLNNLLQVQSQILTLLQSLAPVIVSGSAQSGVTAHPGGGQASATQLAAQVNEVDTVASAADSVKLMASAAGLIVWVYNNGVHDLQIYGLGADTINAVAAATGISIPAGHAAAFMCAAIGKWASVPTAP